jgi:predicted  nucleic acid-binding Zn-ribbon protein
MFFLVLFIALASRAFQLTILSHQELSNLAKMQYQRSSETDVLIKQAEREINKFNESSSSYAILSKTINKNMQLSAERGKLLREVDELKSQHENLSREIQLLQDNLKDLSKVEEDRVKRIVIAYEKIHNKSKYFDFSVNFLMGVLASLIASIIYKSNALKHDLPLIDIFKYFKKILLSINIKPQT